MKVWVVEADDRYYDSGSNDVISIHASEEGARAAAEAYRKEPESWRAEDELEVSFYEVEILP